MRKRTILAFCATALMSMSAVTQAQAQAPVTTTQGGTANTIPMFTSASNVENSVITQSNGNVGIGTARPDAGVLQIAAPDQSTESAIAIRQSNSLGYGFDFALDQNANGMGYLYGVFKGDKTALMQFDRTNNLIGIGVLPPQAKLHISDPAKIYNTTNNEYDSNFELQGTYSGKSVGQGPALGFVVPANTDGTNPWEVARILASPANSNGSDAQGMMFLQTRGYNGSVPWVWNTNLVLASSGNVGIGMTNPAPAYKLDVSGNVHTSGSLTFGDGSTQSTAWTGSLCGGDYAESVDVSDDRSKYELGDVLVIDPNIEGRVLKSFEPYSTSVTGIYSTKPGVVGRRQTTSKSADEIPMAMIGIVPTKVSAENGPIKPGDLLVTSSTPGYAMRGTDRSRMLGAVIGKAFGHLDSGTGVIEVAVTLQ